jgi:TetR/AcrR family transcriptional repressor of nem operon
MAGVRQFNEEVALEKALELFWQKGFSETSMQELAAVTGVQRGSLYNAYQGKETVFLRAFERYQERSLEDARNALAQPRLRDALHGFFNLVIGSMTTGLPTRGCLTTKTAFGGEIIDAPIRSVLRGMLNSYEAILLERLALAGPDEPLALPPEEAARLIVTFTRGIVVIERVYQDPARLLDTAGTLITLLLGPEPSKKQKKPAKKIKPAQFQFRLT